MIVDRKRHNNIHICTVDGAICDINRDIGDTDSVTHIVTKQWRGKVCLYQAWTNPTVYGYHNVTSIFILNPWTVRKRSTKR